MRLYVARSIGTGTPALVDVDPYVDEFGETVTQSWRDDPVRPDCEVEATTITRRIMWRGTPVFLCLTDAETNPAGTLDLGDPEDRATWNVALSNGERAALSNLFGRAVSAGTTRRVVMLDIIDGRDRFVMKIKRQVLAFGADD